MYQANLNIQFACMLFDVTCSDGSPGPPCPGRHSPEVPYVKEKKEK